MDASKAVERVLTELHPKMIERRRDFHRHPEIGFEEVRTSGIVANWLEQLGLEMRTGVACTGIVARIKGGRPGRTVALRADMDALPIQDAKTQCDYRSTRDGFMHACGHDAHTTMLLGAATALTTVREQLAGDVVLLFQPAEEGLGGADRMIREGALDGVDVVLGQHVAPSLPAGVIGITSGAAMANVDFFIIRLKGKGGHGAYPHLTVDSVAMAGQAITALQNIVSRMVDPLQAVVVTIGTVQGGYRDNVIADSVELTGTVRTFDTLVREWAPIQIERIVAGVASAFDGSYEFIYRNDTPAVINPAEGVALMRSVGIETLGKENVIELPPVMGGEDFAYYLNEVPGCFWWVGARHPNPQAQGYGLHHSAFDIDENALVVGARLLAEGALHYLRSEDSDQ